MQIKATGRPLWTALSDNVGIFVVTSSLFAIHPMDPEVFYRALLSCMAASIACYSFFRFYRRSSVFSAENAAHIIGFTLVLEILLAPLIMMITGTLNPLWMCLHGLCLVVVFLMTQAGLNFFSSQEHCD
jgi:ABC-type multidrug transport system permease subunit